MRALERARRALENTGGHWSGFSSVFSGFLALWVPFGVLWVPSGSVWILRGPFGVPSGSPWASLRTLSAPLGFLRGVLGPGRRPFRRTWASLPMDLEAEDAQKHVFLRGLGVGTFGEHAKTRAIRHICRTYAETRVFTCFPQMCLIACVFTCFLLFGHFRGRGHLGPKHTCFCVFSSDSEADVLEKHVFLSAFEAARSVASAGRHRSPRAQRTNIE